MDKNLILRHEHYYISDYDKDRLYALIHDDQRRSTPEQKDNSQTKSLTMTAEIYCYLLVLGSQFEKEDQQDIID